MGKACNIVAQVLLTVFLAMIAFVVWSFNGLLYLPLSSGMSPKRLSELLIYNLGMEKVYLPDNLESKFYVSSKKNDCEVRYAYYVVQQDPSEYIYAKNTRLYNIDRETFESWFGGYVIDDVLVDKKGKAKVKNEYRPKFSDDEKYYCFKYKDTARLIYAYAVYNEENSSLVVCMQTTPYPNEKNLSADKVTANSLSARDMSFAKEGAV